METLKALSWLLIAAGVAGLLIRLGRFFTPPPPPPPASASVEPRPGPVGLGELAERVLRVIATHPEGITLVEIGRELGIDWRQLIAPVNQLLAEGRVEKRDRSYFPR